MNDPMAFLERANLLLSQHRPGEAETWAKKALALEPDNDFALSVLARCHLHNKQYDKGIEVAGKAISIDPENSHYYYLVGFGYYHKNRREEAIGYLYKAIQLSPRHAEYYGLLAFIYFDEGSFGLTLQKANEGLAIDAENITCLNARSRAQNKLRLTSEAIATMQDTLSKDPDNEFTHATIGWNLLEKGKHNDARTHFLEALRISPSYRYAKIGLKESLKSKIPPYRWLLLFSIWLKDKGKGFRWIFAIGIFIGVRIITTLSKDQPGFETIGIVVGGCYILFVATSWFIGPLANVFLLFHKEGKHALDHSEKWNAIAFIICVVSGITILCLSSIATGKDLPGNFIVSGLIAISLAIPCGHMDFPIRLKGNKLPQWISISLLAIAVLSVALGLTGISFAVVLFVLYFILFVVYTWAR